MIYTRHRSILSFYFIWILLLSVLTVNGAPTHPPPPPSRRQSTPAKPVAHHSAPEPHPAKPATHHAASAAHPAKPATHHAAPVAHPAKPAAHHTSDPHSTTTKHAATKAHIATNPHVHLETLNHGAHPHQQTYRGKIAAHDPHQKMDHHQLSQYAQHAYNKIVKDHGDHKGTHLVVSATHKPGDSHVTFHTQPKGQHLNHSSREAAAHPQLGPSMHDHKLTRMVTTRDHRKAEVPWVHAEQAALLHSMDHKSDKTIHAGEHSVGNWGHWKDGSNAGTGGHINPCKKCEGVLNDVGVLHAKNHRSGV